MTKIILTQEISGLGEAGDIVDVKPGYARNYLLPRKLATPFTKGGEKQVLSIQRARRARALATVEDATAAQERLAAMQVKVVARAGATGRLFGTVTATEIAAAVAEQGGPKLDKRKIEVGQRIKALGDYQVKVRLHEAVEARINISVVPA
ncbi:MAG: 50S ribosomal protein L9 [Bifidobacteriaceae bacterium]|jgi:large subunit ribosomal protein L9|nr:50S ribosomal protein L9 [Bifidobacteriaceae bacterium]